MNDQTSFRALVVREENGGFQRAEWHSLDYLRGRPLEYASGDGVIPAVGAVLAEDGRYVIIDSSGSEHQLMTGEVVQLKLTATENNQRG